jgi:hypothetical protein
MLDKIAFLAKFLTQIFFLGIVIYLFINKVTLETIPVYFIVFAAAEVSYTILEYLFKK